MTKLNMGINIKNINEYKGVMSSVPRTLGGTGQVTLKQFFEESETGGFEMVSIDKLGELLNDKTWLESKVDNTRNYNGVPEKNISYRLLKSDETDELIVLYSFEMGTGLGSDCTKEFAVLYDNEYWFTEHIYEKFPVADFKFGKDSKNFFVSVENGVFCGYPYIVITEEDTEDIVYYGDGYGFMSEVNEVEEYLKSIKVDFDEGTIINMAKI